jgi:hypothetical protein
MFNLGTTLATGITAVLLYNIEWFGVNKVPYFDFIPTIYSKYHFYLAWRLDH